MIHHLELMWPWPWLLPWAGHWFAFRPESDCWFWWALGPQIGGRDPRGKTWMRCEMFRLISRLQDLGQKPQQNIGNYWVLYVMKHPTIHWVSLSCSFDKGVANLYPLSKLSTYTAGVEFIVPTPWSRIPRWRLLDNERRWRVATKALGWSLRA